MSPNGTHLDHPEANTAFLRPKRNAIREHASSRNHKSTPRVVSLSLSISLSLSLSLCPSLPHSMAPRVHSIVYVVCFVECTAGGHHGLWSRMQLPAARWPLSLSLSLTAPLSLAHCPSLSLALSLSLTAALSLSLSLPRLGLHLDRSACMAATP